MAYRRFDKAEIDFPRQLRGVCDTVYAKGNLSLLDAANPYLRLVGVTGTRVATHEGLAAAEFIGAKVAENHGILVTGGAAGCGFAAAKAALDAGGDVVIVSGCGVDVAYPASSKPLYDAAEASIGAPDGRALILSLHPDPQEGVHRNSFPARNELIAALSSTLFVAEAGTPSGVLSTARRAAEFGNSVVALPGSVFSPAAAGAHELAAEGTAELAMTLRDLEARVRFASLGYVPFAELSSAQQDRVMSADPTLRRSAAEEGLGLEVLVADEDFGVREAVAFKGYGLDRLLNDPSGYVRYIVARQGYRLDALVDDPFSEVRRAVAEQGFALDVLIDDHINAVRCAVAEQSFGLDKLADDEDPEVRRVVRDVLRRHRLTVDEWAELNPEKCASGDERRPEQLER